MRLYDRTVLTIPTPTTISECELIDTEIEVESTVFTRDQMCTSDMEIHTLEDCAGGDA